MDPYRDQILDYLQMGLNLAAVRKIDNNQLKGSISYNSYKYFVHHDEQFQRAWIAQRSKSKSMIRNIAWRKK